MRGRKPTPTHLKLVRGNPGRRPLNPSEPIPVGSAAKPKFLKGRAAALWDQYAPELMRLGVLTVVDSHMFAAWCSLAAEFEKDPRMMTAARIGQMRGLAAAFGMDASARSRLSVKVDDQTKDPADRYFAS
jgi:phage terminase small subunit